jgi:hypothetical protein
MLEVTKQPENKRRRPTMKDSIGKKLGKQIERLRKSYGQQSGLPFRAALSSEVLSQSIEEEIGEYRDRVYPPVVTLSAMLSQGLSEDRSCREAVGRVLADRVSRGEAGCSSDTGGYCKARERLPEAWIQRLMQDSGRQLEEQVPQRWCWRGRRVKLIDGTTVSMPDTAANQADYPQPSSQGEGLGFPKARLVVVTSLSSGAVLELAIGSYSGKESGEHGLLRRLLDTFEADEVGLGDGYYGTYWLLAELIGRGADGVFEVHARRQVVFKPDQKEQWVVWSKPEQRPQWMSRARYEQMPARLTLRLIKSNAKVLVTSLLNKRAFPRRALMKLYSQRWLVEVDLKFIKTVLQMEILRGHTPAMVRKEIYTHLLAYNLIRTVMAQAAVYAGIPARQLSFKGALQMLNAFRGPVLAASDEQRARLYQELWRAIARHRIGQRPGRREPRAIKRRPKAYPFLTRPRSQAREKLFEQAQTA